MQLSAVGALTDALGGKAVKPKECQAVCTSENTFDVFYPDGSCVFEVNREDLTSLQKEGYRITVRNKHRGEGDPASYVLEPITPTEEQSQ
jgi:hypothetical protein